MDDPKAADLWDAIFADSNRSVVRSVFDGIAHQGLPGYATPSRFSCAADDLTDFCADGKSIVFNDRQKTDSVVVLCQPFFGMERNQSCRAFEHYADWERVYDKVSVMLHWSARRERQGLGQIVDQDLDGKRIYTKAEVTNLAAAHKADPQIHLATAYIAEAYVVFAAAVRSRFADECKAKYEEGMRYSCDMTFSWFFTLAGAQMTPTLPDPRGCGRGLLDNLRGQCGVVTNWECWPIAGPGYSATWKIAVQLSDRCIRDALWLSSGKEIAGGCSAHPPLAGRR
ncbi:MAG: hypothetical protein M1832_002000 [Thelocarpon impressellum]|nr:MAG: hypothetical protein M1832_002000 [Thelocarpon impressellum]